MGKQVRESGSAPRCGSKTMQAEVAKLKGALRRSAIS